MKFKSLFVIGILLIFTHLASISQNEFSPEDLLSTNSIGGIELNPAGSEVIYTLYSPRTPNETPGGSHSEYIRLNLKTGDSESLFPKEQTGSSPQWSPDGLMIGFLFRAEGELTQVWAMPSSGGPVMQLTNSESSINSFKWGPDGRSIAYLSRTPESEREKELSKRGYDFIFYEENLKNTNLHLARFDADWNQIDSRQLSREGNVWDFEFNHQGDQIAATLSPKNLIDHRYMFRHIYIFDLATDGIRQVSKTKGKLGNYAFSPNGQHLAYTGALNINDHQVSQLYLINLQNGSTKNLTPPDFRGHVSWVQWKDDNALIYYSGEGVYPKLNLVSLTGGDRTIILNAENGGIIFSTPTFSADFKNLIFTGSTPTDPVNLYRWDGQGTLEKLTDINPDISSRNLGKQEVIRYNARDGQQIEGILILPVNYKKENAYPLVVYVHGGPESHHSNGWLSRYATPGQVMAGKGYMVAFLNYRASTGYGVDFAMEGFSDPAGKEFDDIADAIDFLVAEKGADANRVGLAGGSYGGYASAWFATYYTKYVKAVCMFVGISDLISKRGTTDIPYEDMYVHMGKKLEDQWQFMLERSPVYYAHQSETATLIYGGAADTRVHPSQSFELYRRMKMNDHPAVRLVQYPGEGHGNRKQVGQIDVLYRQLDWFDWYVRDMKPLDGPMPPLDISDHYGLDWAY